MLILLIAVIVLGLAVLVFVYIEFFFNKADAFSNFLKKEGIKRSGKTYKYAMTLSDEVKNRVIKVFRLGGDLIKMNGDPLDAAILIANRSAEIADYDRFFYCYKLILTADPYFTVGQMVHAYSVCGDDHIEKFARSWIDQKNADLKIPLQTAMEFISKNRDFDQLVNIDIMAKRAGLEIDEKRLVNDVDDEGIKQIIYSLIRAKYEGIYLSDEESAQINKANVLEYNDTFKITIELLKQLHLLKRDVSRFTNVMIRAHNSGIRINFSLNDLYSLTDDDFDNLVSNIISASDKGISIDQKDLIRQNIVGTDITNLVQALIKANEYGLDLTPDELMNYLVNTRADVILFVKAYNYILKNKITVIDKDELIEFSRPTSNLFDYVQGLGVAKKYEREGKIEASNNFGITYKNVKDHFKKFGVVMNAINAVESAQKKGLNMTFPLAGQILASGKYTLQSAVAWAQNPQVIEVNPCLTCVCKDGVQVTPKINITVRGKMPLIFAGYREDVLFKRINEAVVFEFESAESHDGILKHLPEISQSVLNRINEEDNQDEIKTDMANETELNNHSAYQLLDVNIFDLIIGQNIKAELELRQAQIQSEMRKLKAEADRAKAEADLRIAMVQQYKGGTKPNFNELHKANLLEEKSKGIDTGYGVSEE